MKKNEHHLAAALEHLIEAAEAFTAQMSRRDASGAAEWRHEYGYTLAVEYARRALMRHRTARHDERVPAELLLQILERGA
jgi:hypothetical protein